MSEHTLRTVNILNNVKTNKTFVNKQVCQAVKNIAARAIVVNVGRS